MRASYVLLVCTLAISTVATYRLPRDVSELTGNSAQQPQQSEAGEESGTTLTKQGYEYRQVRQLRYRYRTRRDVSHLNREYLPPIVTPSREYLPPTEESITPATPTAAKLSNEYLPPVEEVKESESSTLAASQDTTTELPAANDDTATATSGTAVASAEAESAVEAEKAAEAETVAAEAAAAEETAAAEEEEQDTAVLLDDGYHYKQPAFVPDLLSLPVDPLPLEPEVYSLNSELPGAPLDQENLADGPVENEIDSEKVYLPPVADTTAEAEPTAEVNDPRQNEITPEQEYLPPIEEATAPEQTPAEPSTREYLPPLEAGIVEAEGAAEDTAVLAEDGYHYRAIKRIRF